MAVGSPCSSGVLQKTTCLDIHTGHLQNRNFFFLQVVIPRCYSEEKLWEGIANQVRGDI